MDVFKDKLFLAVVSAFLAVICAIFGTSGFVGAMLNDAVFGKYFVSYLIATFLAGSFGISVVYFFALFLVEMHAANTRQCAKGTSEAEGDNLAR